MKILLISPYFYPHKGGSQQYMEELYSHLMKLDPKIQVDVVCYNTNRSKEIEEYRNFKIYRVPCFEILPGQFAVPNYFRLWELLQRLHRMNTYTFFHANTRFFESSWWTPFIAKTFGVQSILTDHCANFPTHPSRFVTFIAKLVDKVVSPFIANKYNLVTVTNNATKEFTQELGIKNPQLVYGGVDTDYFTPDMSQQNRIVPVIQRPFKPDDIVITFLGRMIYSKGPQLLHEVACDVIKEYKNVHFVFAGDGAMLKELALDEMKRIYFTGSLEKDQIKTLLQTTDILVHPSLHHEGFPNVLLEAGASGCAVIATDMGGTREIIINQQTGLLVEPDKAQIKSALMSLIENANVRRTLSSSLRKHIEKRFGWTHIVRGFRATLRDMETPTESLLTVGFMSNN